MIILLTFRSITIPALLVLAIEGAIMVNMGIPYFTGSTIPFIASIVLGTIQLGATVDYAIIDSETLVGPGASVGRPDAGKADSKPAIQNVSLDINSFCM